MWRMAARSRSRCARSSWRLSLLGSTALIAAFVATKGGGRTGPAPPSAATAAAAKRRMAGAGYFASRCKAPFRARRKIVGGRHCVAGPLAAGSPSQEGRERGPLRKKRSLRIDGAASGRGTSFVPYSRPNPRAQEAGYVFRRDLDAQRCAQRIDIEVLQILIEVSTLGRQHHRLDPDRLRPVEQSCHRAIARPIVVTDDIETAQRHREQD